MQNKWENFSLEKKVKQVFDNQAGRELIEFFTDTFLMRRSWVEGKFDSTAFAEGQKDVILLIKHLAEKPGSEE